MMAWPEEPQSRAGDWPESELLESAAFYTPDPDERAQHGANNFAGQNQSGLTYSASCPSFSGMDDADNLMAETGAGNGLLPYPFGAQEPLVDVIGPGDPLFSGDKNYDMLLEFQQEYQNSSQRQFPHQQAMGQPMDLVQQQMAGGRRGFHGSQSFTSLSSMETDYNRMNASKRKKGTERWMKLQRHKSFDSTTPLTEPFGLGDATFGGNFNSVNASTGAEMLQNSSDRDIIGFSIDDFSSTMPSDDPNWPPMSYGSAPSAIGGSYMQEAHQPHLQQMSMQTSDSDVDKSVSSSAEVEPASELDMLLSENERANLFDAIRDFESPSDTGMLFDTQPSPEQPPQQLPLETKERSAVPLAGKKKPSFRVPSGTPPTGCVPMRTRLQQILVHSVMNSDAGSSLSSYERNYLMTSSLFFPAKAPETAGSLWLLLHAAQCENGCEIAGCSVMRRVLNHCLGCELVVGKCKQPCNDAKAMLLHYGSCNSKGSMHGRSCSVCWNLLEIDYSHQAISHGNISRSSGQTPNNTPASLLSSPSPRMGMGTPPNLMPMPMSPGMAGSPAYRSPSRRGPSNSKHVPIQPNPLPTASNPMGLIGGLPPHFGYSLSLYLEQTSAPFRAEVKSRVEKRVTAAAGQDLLQHMQKKTRLRSLDDLRSEARTIVLGEMERELHFHMQAYNWANSTAGASPDGAAQLPPYLLNFSTAGFGAFQAQQAALQAAMTSSSRPPSAPSTSPQGAPKRTRSASNSSKLASSGSSSKVSVREK
ncbi:hypothetical protein BBP00_00005018 [Phytophthora kernoviae]|uniref:TAZ-type domain-containing protein n=1 Tax=Phytophthora kernoviae TaxID=325452 RepID=A0A3F2RQ23_9STRA|nr:hypothetical protein BBP00_00005018 [Phytophthora kernoviae]